jgi:CRP-like cAMP-binding protein
MHRDPADESLANVIARHRLFHDLSERHVAMLAGAAARREFARDEMIFREGEPANRFYLILNGEVALERSLPGSAPTLMQVIGRDDVLGWSWLFPPHLWRCGARATEPTQAVFFDGTWLREQCERDTDFGYEMIKRMSAVVLERLQVTRRKLG